ncbi:hypothetical protein X801_10077 [Opisthorchis viverrini]|uniref:Uncharacterized protein n=1 Tax=Opisthorchis viverrini TaxID=6198 RepID=A0A1S8WI63_OPIVI|nr:hypothetical protein X801_10077 [Opisthorchis viverrini]
MQHLVALSILLACKQLIAERLGALNGHQCAFEVDEELLVNLQHSGPQLRLKWPNDVYVVWNENKQCGDVASSSPNCPRSGKLAGMLTRCSLVGDKEANFIIEGSEKNRWASNFGRQDPSHCVLGNQTVKVCSNKNGSPTFGRQCTITGLDAFGYLLVRDNETGEQFSLHPDGNSMDMMLGLIKPK